MAKLSFGEITAQIDVPKQSTPDFDPMELVKKVVDMLPKPAQVEVPKVDLSPLEKRLADLDEAYACLKPVITNIQEQIQSLESRKIEMAPAGTVVPQATVVVPEVKTIHHTTDISPDVLDQCRRMVKDSEQIYNATLKEHQEQHNKNVKKQKTVNRILIIGLIITTLLHLI